VRAAGVAASGEERLIWWGQVATRARVVALAELAADRPSAGPLLVLDGEAVCAVPPDWTVTREADGGMLWERRD
jgi:hypothetical protein